MQSTSISSLLNSVINGSVSTLLDAAEGGGGTSSAIALNASSNVSDALPEPIDTSPVAVSPALSALVGQNTPSADSSGNSIPASPEPINTSPVPIEVVAVGVDSVPEPIGTSPSVTVSVLPADAVVSLGVEIQPLLTDPIPPGAFLTNNPAPTMTGTATTFTLVTIRTEDGTVVGSTPVDADGNWSFKLPQQSEGAHTFLVTAMNEAGNFSTASITYVIDTTPPSAVVQISAIHEDTGVSATDFVTKDNTLLVDAKIVSGTLDPDERVQISLDGGQNWHETTALGGGVYQFDAQGTPLADGTYHFQARAIDQAGNAGPALDQIVVIDTTPPSATTINYIDSVGPEQGVFGDGTTTDDSRPVLTGRLGADHAPGDVVSIYEGSKLLGQATVTGQDWTFDLGALGTLANDTTHTYTAIVTDLAGNDSQASSLSFSVHVPPVPDASINYQTVIIDTKTNTKAMDWINKKTDVMTLAATPLVSGVLPYRLENGEYMEVTINGMTYSSKTGAVNVNQANDGWSVQVPTANALKVGTYDVSAVVKSADGSVLSHDDTMNELTVQQNQYKNSCYDDWWCWPKSYNAMVSVPATTPKGSDYTFTDVSKGGNTIQSGGGNDTFNLIGSAHDTLLFRLLDKADSTGGNGSDQVNGFIVGSWGAKSQADRIDLSEVLIGYHHKSSSGPARFVKGVATIDAGDKIGDYLSVTHKNGDTIINIDRDGAGGQFSSTALVTLHGVNTDLATLLANHQILVEHH
jgi:hypothetical protein